LFDCEGNAPLSGLVIADDVPIMMHGTSQGGALSLDIASNTEPFDCHFKIGDPTNKPIEVDFYRQRYDDAFDAFVAESPWFKKEEQELYSSKSLEEQRLYGTSGAQSRSHANPNASWMGLIAEKTKGMEHLTQKYPMDPMGNAHLIRKPVLLLQGQRDDNTPPLFTARFAKQLLDKTSVYVAQHYYGTNQVELGTLHRYPKGDDAGYTHAIDCFVDGLKQAANTLVPRTAEDYRVANELENRAAWSKTDLSTGWGDLSTIIKTPFVLQDALGDNYVDAVDVGADGALCIRGRNNKGTPRSLNLDPKGMCAPVEFLGVVETQMYEKRADILQHFGISVPAITKSTTSTNKIELQPKKPEEDSAKNQLKSNVSLKKTQENTHHGISAIGTLNDPNMPGKSTITGAFIKTTGAIEKQPNALPLSSVQADLNKLQSFCSWQKNRIKGHSEAVRSIDTFHDAAEKIIKSKGARLAQCAHQNFKHRDAKLRLFADAVLLISSLVLVGLVIGGIRSAQGNGFFFSTAKTKREEDYLKTMDPEEENENKDPFSPQ
jgi:hypothetical protein